MTEVMQGLVSEAKKNKFSTIGPSLSDEDVVSVWDGVSNFIEKHMCQQKGVNIPGLGTFTFSQKKLDVGNNKFILIQRPVFLLSERFAQTHGLIYTKHHTTGEIPVVQLNYAALSFESPFDRDSTEACVREVLQALSRSVGARRNVEFTFNGIGRLQIREGKVKMKFYKEFINSMDGSGRLVDALRDRPGTVDSVMSDRCPSRPLTSNTLVLPRITQGATKLALESDNLGGMATIREGDEGEAALGVEEQPGEMAGVDQVGVDQVEQELADIQVDVQPYEGDDMGLLKKPSPPPGLPPSRQGSRVAVPLPKATGVSFGEDLMPQISSSRNGKVPSVMKSSPTPLMNKRALSPLIAQPELLEVERPSSSKPLKGEDDGIAGTMSREELVAKYPKLENLERRERTSPTLGKLPHPPKAESPPGSAGSCGHPNAGQELCYLCHQRERRNIPVSFTEERRRREQEEDRLLQQYQHMKDTEALLSEQGQLFSKRHENQKMAAFNLGVAEAIKQKQGARPTVFHPSYIFQKRPLTPPRFIKQDIYYKDLAEQVNAKDDVSKKRKADDEFLERLEQVQLAEDLAAQREQYLKDKAEQQEQYKRALSAQVKFKPMPMPARVSDSSEPVFGKNDANIDSMAEKRRRAHQLYQDQLGTVEARKRDAILRQLQEQKDEEEMLDRTKKELLHDRAEKFERLFNTRRRLEQDWARAVESKRLRERDEALYSSAPGVLLHEQCDKYSRCAQCKRRVNNCGESNIWCESRYIPGSRLMV